MAKAKKDVVEGTEATAVAAKKADTVIESVKMLDGRIVDFPGKKRMIKSSFKSEATGELVVSIDFRNGATVNFPLPASLIDKFALHGAEQKLGDATAGETDIDDAVMAVEDTIKHLQAGDWNEARESGGMSGTSTLLKAIVEVLGKPVPVVQAYLAGKTQKEKLALRNSDKFYAVVKRIDDEKAAKKGKVDVTNELAELEAL